jgi:hypothetical protein
MAGFSTSQKKKQAFKSPKAMKLPGIKGTKAKGTAAATSRARKGGFAKMKGMAGKAGMRPARKKASPPPIGPKRKKQAPPFPGAAVPF